METCANNIRIQWLHLLGVWDHLSRNYIPLCAS